MHSFFSFAILFLGKIGKMWLIIVNIPTGLGSWLVSKWSWGESGAAI